MKLMMLSLHAKYKILHYSLAAKGLSSLHSVLCGLELLSIFSSAFESTITLALSILLGKGNGGSTIKPIKINK